METLVHFKGTLAIFLVPSHLEVLDHVVCHDTEEVLLIARECCSGFAVEDVNRPDVDASACTQGYTSIVPEVRWSCDETKFVEAYVLTQIEYLETGWSALRWWQRRKSMFTQSTSFRDSDALRSVSVMTSLH